MRKFNLNDRVLISFTGALSDEERADGVNPYGDSADFSVVAVDDYSVRFVCVNNDRYVLTFPIDVKTIIHEDGSSHTLEGGE